MLLTRPYAALTARLDAIVTLSDEDKAILAGMPATIRTYDADQDIARDGDVVSQCCLLLNGFLYRHKLVESSKRQIMSVYVPGDIPDLLTLHLPRMDHTLSSSGVSTVAFVPHAFFRKHTPASPGLTHALWRETLVDAAMFREWVVNVGSRDAMSRVAHLLCEIAVRMRAVRLLSGRSFTFPFTQRDVADACGLSAVHANRTIQALKRRRLIEWEARTVTILHPGELIALADFSPDYLHLKNPDEVMSAL